MKYNLDEILKKYNLIDFLDIDYLDEQDYKDLEITDELVEFIGEVIMIDEYSTHKGYEGMYIFYLPKHDYLLRHVYYENGHIEIEELERVGRYGIIQDKKTTK
jgi:hypothetical protein